MNRDHRHGRHWTEGRRAFDGYLVRKDLVRKYSRQYPVPTYVVEFLLGRYCASTDEAEIAEGLQIVEKQLRDRTVRTGEEELFKARAKRAGLGQADRHRSRPARREARLLPGRAAEPGLLKTVQIADTLVKDNERMLTDGFYAEVTLEYDAVIAQERNGQPVPHRRTAPSDPDVEAPTCSTPCAKGGRAFTDGPVAAFPDPLRRLGAFGRCRSAPSGRAAADGPVRGAQLQHGRARAAGHRQEPPLPADLPLLAPDLRWQGHGREDVREQRQRSAGPRLPVRRRLLRRRSRASPSTRRTASTS